MPTPWAYLLTALLAGLLAAIVTAILPRLDRRGLLSPRLGRRERPLPMVGGAALFVALALGPFLAALLLPAAAKPLEGHLRELAGLLAAGGLIVALGIVDDRLVLDFKLKLLGVGLAAGILFVFGYRLERMAFPWGPTLELGPWAPLATLVWVVFITNAVNLVDGKDGVAAGVCALAGASLAAVSHHAGQGWPALLLAATTAAALGFLPFNRPPASRLLGDSGALLLGLVLSALAIKGALGPGGAVFISIPAVALGFPVVDASLALTRRALDKRHPFRGDLDHMHHRLEQALGPWGLLAALYGLSALFAGAALALHWVENDAAEGAVLAAFVVTVGFSLHRLGYTRSLRESAVVRSLRPRREPVKAPQPD